MLRLDTEQADFDQCLERLTAWDEGLDREVARTVSAIIDDVARRGDEAVLQYTAQFDRLKAESVAELEVSGQRLRAALEDLAHGMPIPVEIDATAERLPASVEAAAYFIVCEAVTNSVKHGRPTAVRVEATREDDRLQLVITDDGVGGATPGAGSGLAGLADRVDAHGGRLEIDSPPGAGTRVVAELPCAS